VTVTHLLTLRGRLDELELELLDLTVRTIVASGARDVVVDLSMVELPDPALVEALGRACERVTEAGGLLSAVTRDGLSETYTIERLDSSRLASLG
jgi:anti-anti-sigma regulatory factor